MKTKEMTQIALFTALFCIMAPMSIPIGAVPISFTNFVIYLSAYLIGTKNGTISYLLYCLLGIFGLPVFSGYTGGFAKAVGPTGGFLAGMIFTALICGMFVERTNKKVLHFIGMCIGTLIAYLLGTVWFCIVTGQSPAAAFVVCIAPFIIGDLIKMILAIYIGNAVRNTKKISI